MTKKRIITNTLTALATIFAVAAPAHAADDLMDRTRVLNVFNASANSALPATGMRAAPADPASPSNTANLARDWISVVSTFSSTLEEAPDGSLMQCATLRISPEDTKQLEPLKSLHLPISVGDVSLADILQPQTDSGLLYGSCVPYETPLSKEQRAMIRDRNWDGLAASGIAISHKTIVRIMDAANKGVLQEMNIEAISDPARDSRILMRRPVQDMPSAYTLKPAL